MGTMTSVAAGGCAAAPPVTTPSTTQQTSVAGASGGGMTMPMTGTSTGANTGLLPAPTGSPQIADVLAQLQAAVAQLAQLAQAGTLGGGGTTAVAGEAGAMDPNSCPMMAGAADAQAGAVDGLGGGPDAAAAATTDAAAGAKGGKGKAKGGAHTGDDKAEHHGGAHKPKKHTKHKKAKRHVPQGKGGGTPTQHDPAPPKDTDKPKDTDNPKDKGANGGPDATGPGTKTNPEILKPWRGVTGEGWYTWTSPDNMYHSAKKGDPGAFYLVKGGKGGYHKGAPPSDSSNPVGTTQWRGVTGPGWYTWTAPDNMYHPASQSTPGAKHVVSDGHGGYKLA